MRHLFNPYVVLPALLVHGLCFAALLSWLFRPPLQIILFVVLSALAFELVAGIFLFIGMRTTVTEQVLLQSVLGCQTRIEWHERGVRISRGVFFRLVKAPGRRRIFIPTHFSALKCGDPYLLLCRKLKELASQKQRP